MKGYLMIMYYLEQSILLTSSLLVCVLCPPTYLRHTHTRIHGIDGTEAWKGKKINFYSFLLSFSLYIELNEHGSYHFYCTSQPVLTPWKACWCWQTWCGPLFLYANWVQACCGNLFNIYSVISYLKVVSFFHSVSNAVPSAFFNKKVLESTQMLPKLKQYSYSALKYCVELRVTTV